MMSTAIIVLTLDEIDGVKQIVPEIKEEWVEEFNKYMVEFYEEEMKQLKKSHLKIIK